MTAHPPRETTAHQSFFPADLESHDDAHAEHPEPLDDGDLPHDDSLGGGIEPAIAGRQSKRKKTLLAAALGVTTLFVATCFIGNSSGKKAASAAPTTATKAAPNGQGRFDQAVQAQRATKAGDLGKELQQAQTATVQSQTPPSQDFLDADRLQQAAQQDQFVRKQAERRMGNAQPGRIPADFIDPNDPKLIADAGAANTGGPSTATGGASGGSTYTPLPGAATSASDYVVMPPGSQAVASGLAAPGTNARGASGDGATTIPMATGGNEIARQRALDAARERLKITEQERRAAEQHRKQEDQRLKTQGTLLASNQQVVSATIAVAGKSRFAVAPTVTPPSANNSSSASVNASVAASDKTTTSADRYDILPGTQVTAVLTADFVSDAQGAGPVAVRLTSPLKLRDGTVLLPAGSRAFGRANGSAPAVGRQASVQMVFNVFVTEPDKTVIRDGLAGRGADPATLALSVPADADNRFFERIVRGVTSTAVELALTSPTQNQQRSLFIQPTPYERAVDRGSQRAANLINGPIGDEQSVHPAVHLDRGASLVIVFGLQ